MPEEIFETPQPTQLTEPKTTNWPKIILAAVLGLGLLVATTYAGYWYGTQQVPKTGEPAGVPQPAPLATTGPIADWKTYVSKEYGFSIGYPPEMRVNEFSEKNYLFSVEFDPGEEHFYSVVQIKNFWSLDEAVDWKKNQIANNPYHDEGSRPFFNFYSEGNVALGTIRGFKLAYDEGPFSLVTYILLKENSAYFISASPERIESTISTFKFLD